MSELLYQGEVWWARENGQLREHKLSEMTRDHIVALRAWLLRQADSIQHSIFMRLSSGPQPSGDAACDAFEGVMAEFERAPDIWMREMPLFEALTERMERADGVLTKSDLRVIKRALKQVVADPMLNSARQIKDAEATLRKVENMKAEQ